MTRPLQGDVRGEAVDAASLARMLTPTTVASGKAGGSVAATLPKEMADRLNLRAGDRVLAVETDKGIFLTPYDPTTIEALALAAKAARR